MTARGSKVFCVFCRLIGRPGTADFNVRETYMHVRFSILIASLVLPADSLSAQVPPWSDTLPVRAAVESLSVLRTLEAYVKQHPKDAGAQHKLGALAFAIQQAALTPGAPPALDARKLRSLAENALQAALNLEPKNTLHWLTLGRFYTTGVGNPERLPRIYYDAGIALAREQRDTAMIALMGMELGTLHWRHAEHASKRGAQVTGEIILPTLEELANPGARPRERITEARAALGYIDDPPPGTIGITVRRLAPRSVTGAAGIDSNRAIPYLMANAYEKISEVIHPWGGITAESFYLNAESYVREAREMSRADAAIFLRLAGVLLLEDRWADLQSLAESQTRLTPADPWAWMAFGLAQHRLRASSAARAAFDKGLALLHPSERARLDRIDRVLAPKDAAAYARGDSATRAQTSRALWKIADPLWSEDEEDARTEFLARLAYAEIRYTWWDGSVRGAETPAGMLHIRYGPPDEIRGGFSLYRSGIVLSGCMLNSDALVRDDNRRLSPGNEVCARDRDLVHDLLAWQPALWDNIAAVRIDSIPTQVARFRASNDSVDVYFAAQAPIDAMRSVQAANSTVQGRFWLYAWNSPEERTHEIDPLGAPGLMEFRERVPRGDYYYRIESTVPGALVAGRAAASVRIRDDPQSGFATRGFGMSDILLATSVRSDVSPRRWSDIALTPALGGVPRGAELTLIWENYELRRRGADAEYRVTVRIERDRPGPGRIAATIKSITERVGMTSSANRLQLQFPRKVPYAIALLDNLVLDLGSTPPGNYIVTVSVADAVSGRITQRAAPITIRR